MTPRQFPNRENVLVRIDEVELKGFDGLRPIYTLAPRDDPGLADSQAARNALDQQIVLQGDGTPESRR